MPESKIGIVKWFDAKKGYGFISVDDQDDIFVHFSNVTMDGFRKLDMGNEVDFDLKQSKDGKSPEALNVKIVSKDRKY
ncbi:MAG: cold shock domain-containing protein [Candidatus Lokiarchaeota archaeon]|nr:cold shock domain-containing protein [Candidatus Lokiarchaeota archaeon]